MRIMDCHVPEGKEDMLWSLVKDPGEFWHDLSSQSERVLRVLLEGGMAAYREKWTGAGWHEVESGRRGYCNGFYRRKRWVTSKGDLGPVRVPRCRERGLTEALLRAFQEGTRPMEAAAQEMFLAGVSTRRVGELLEPILGIRMSATQVSRITPKLNREVRGWHERRLEDRYVYLFVDAIFLKARSAPSIYRAKGRGRIRAVLVAYGVTCEGIKELIEFRVVGKETKAGWVAFLEDLVRRGLTGAHLQLVVSDGGPGVVGALDEVYPFARRQRCWFHKMGNVVSKVRVGDRLACAQQLRTVCQASGPKQAEKRYRTWAEHWRKRYPDAVRCVDADLEALLAFFHMPSAHWKMVRTTNAIERCFREVRRRTHSIGCFMDDSSLERLVFALFSYLNKKRALGPCREFRIQAQAA